MARTLIILPTYNEARNIARLVAALNEQVPAADLLIVDDGSPDGTGAIADGLAASDPRVRVLQRGAKLGLGTAHKAGFDHAVQGGYDVVVTMDCDFTHRPEDVPRLLAALVDRSTDVVVGSRYAHPRGIADWPVSRRFVTWTSHLSMQVLLGITIDATNAFRAYRVPALASVPYGRLFSNGYSFMVEMAYLCWTSGLSMVEIPVELPYRQAGKSKISNTEIVKGIVTLGRLTARRVRSAAKGRS